MRTRLGFFPYEAMNYKAGQAYLDRKAAKGWELRKIYLGCIARFTQAENPRHFVDLDIRPYLEEPDQDYLQLCADAGWEFIQALRGMLFFRRAEGAAPAPIQSDGGIEWERFWRKYARKNLLSSLLVLLVSAALVAFVLTATPGPGRSVVALIASNGALVYLLALGLGLLGILLSFIGVPLYLLRCRRSGQVETPGRVWAWVQDAPSRIFNILYLLAAVLALMETFGMTGVTADLGSADYTQEETATVEACREYPVVMATDLGLNAEPNSRFLDGHRALLGEFLNYTELTQEGETRYTLTTERYECAGEALAGWVFDQRAWETQNGAFLWGELPWEEAPGLGFQESYVCREGSYLLVRQGKVVALVGCSGLDLTAPERLAVVRTRLGLY